MPSVPDASDARDHRADARDHRADDDTPSSSFIAFPTDVPPRAGVADRADAVADADEVEHHLRSPVRSGNAPWEIARARTRDDSEDGGAHGDVARGGSSPRENATTSRPGRARMSGETYETYLRPILERMPVKPERVSAVNGPLMNVTRIDDETLDVTMTTSFRAHFGGNLSNVARRPAMALPGANVPDVLVRADGTWEDANGGVRISELDSGEFVPGRGGRYSVMTHEDSWNAIDSDARATSPAIGWYEGDPSNDALRTEFTVDPADVRLQERIAVGGFAEVFRGTWQGTVVAVKQLLERTNDVKERLEQEVEVLVKLRHPNLLLFMGYCVDPPLICTEFMRRGSLHTILKGGKVLEPERTHAVAIAVARGMSYLHSRSPPILHLDLKSPNILVDEKWRVKIADFGLARMRQATQVSAKSEFHGTPEWMAPEMLRAESYDERADSYSFGVVLWELLTARKPWDDLHPMQVVAVVGYSQRRLELPPEGVENASHASIAVISRVFRACASKDQDERPLFPSILADFESAKATSLANRRLATRPPLDSPTDQTSAAPLGVQLEYISLNSSRDSAV